MGYPFDLVARPAAVTGDELLADTRVTSRDRLAGRRLLFASG
jgi:hypothetical protein